MLSRCMYPVPCTAAFPRLGPKVRAGMPTRLYTLVSRHIETTADSARSGISTPRTCRWESAMAPIRGSIPESVAA